MAGQKSFTRHPALASYDAGASAPLAFLDEPPVFCFLASVDVSFDAREGRGRRG
jgi:hypothetical protein